MGEYGLRLSEPPEPVVVPVAITDDDPGPLSTFRVGVIGLKGTVVTKCRGCRLVQVVQNPDGDQPDLDLADLVRAAVRHLRTYHPDTLFEGHTT